MNTAEFHSTRKFADTPFGRIAYAERGAGPAALFLHGLPLCGYQWRGALEDLADIRRVVAPDLIGLGYSEVPPEQDGSFAAQARMVAALLDALGIDSVDLCGNDTGGGISEIFAATYPGRVRSLTLTNCEVHDRWPNAMLTQFYKGVETGLFAQGMKAMLNDIGLARGQMGMVYENPEAITPELLQLYFEPILSSEARIAQLARFSDWNRSRTQLMDAAPALRESKAPAQVIWGDADSVFDTASSIEWLRANMGGLRKITIVPRAKLFFPEEHPRLVSVMLREFWSGLD